MKANALLAIACCAWLTACGESHPSRLRWSQIPKGASSAVPQSILLKKDGSPQLRVSSEVLLRKQQYFGGVRVRDHWVKNLVNGSGQLVFAEGTPDAVIPPKLESEVLALKAKKGEILEKLRRKVPGAAAAAKVLDPELELVKTNPFGKWSLRWVMDYLDQSEENIFRVEASSSGRVLGVRRVGSHFVNAVASVYPQGPRMSQLSDVLLRRMLGDGSLNGETLQVSSWIDPSARSPEHVFRYPVENPKFDEVQVYYYVDRALNWFKENAGVTLPFKLDVKVHVGGVESPRNTAYYYRGMIRLGDGDGVVYRAIPRDPSVVIHETSHAVVDVLAKLPYEGQGGSLNEAYADFFAANILGNPSMGEVSYVAGPYRRTLLDHVALSEANGGLYHDSQIVSGALWEIRSKIGPQQGFQLALKSLLRLGPDSKLEDFRDACVSAVAEGFPESEKEQVLAVLNERGWK